MVVLIAWRITPVSGGHAVYTLGNKEIRRDKAIEVKSSWEEAEMSCSISRVSSVRCKKCQTAYEDGNRWRATHGRLQTAFGIAPSVS